MTERILIGVAWPYANGSLHIGQIAGAYLPADIFARFHRTKGNDVLMVSGSDCHGTPITVRAEKEGRTPSDVVDQFHNEFLTTWNDLGIGFDLFTKTATDNHQKVVHDMFLKLYEQKYIVPGVMELPFDPIRKRFLPDRYVEGTCPICSHDPARGDQCDNCGNTLEPSQLINPRSTLSGAVPEIKESKHLFLRLGAFEEKLKAWIEPKRSWRKNVRNSSLGWLHNGLRDRAITRDISWGIPVPVEGFEDKRIYVWFEAVIGYLSASIEWAQNRHEPDAWKPYWTDPETKSYYFLAKDNTPFHTIIWPAMLIGYGGLNLPYDVPANEYLTMSGTKASTSRGWAVWVTDFLARYDADQLRYVLSRNMPETADSEFTWDEFLRKNNGELVATWGNLANRVLTFTYRNFEGRVPAEPSEDARSQSLLSAARKAVDECGAALEKTQFRKALALTLELAQATNRYLDETEPWKRLKDDRAAAAAALATALGAINALKLLFSPYLPFSSEALDRMLGFDGAIESRGWRFEPIPRGQELSRPKPLFKKPRRGG